MNSRDFKHGLDWLGVSIRLALRQTAGRAEPPADVRRRLLERAMQRQRERNYWEPDIMLAWTRGWMRSEPTSPASTVWSDLAYLNLVRGLGFNGQMESMLR